MLKVIELSDEQINNCNVFLNRANLTGAEAEAMVMIKVALNNAKSCEDYVRVQTAAKSNASKK